MKFLNSFRNFFYGKNQIVKLEPGKYDLLDKLSIKANYNEYAISICINKIANAISQCIIETYDTGKENKGSMWYKFNVEPNVNQNITEFWHKLIYEMVIQEHGALVIQLRSEDFVIADSYTVEKFATKENIYKNIVVNGFKFDNVYSESEILRFKLNNINIKELIQQQLELYQELLNKAVSSYKRLQSRKVFVKIDAIFDTFKNKINPDTGESEYDETLDDLFKNRLKAHFSENDSATPIENGLEIVDKSDKASGSKYKETDDIRSLFDDIINITADAFNMPRGLLKGDVADVETMTDNFISFCINPIASLIEDEINRKLYGEESVLSGSKLRIKTYSIKGYDPTKLASSAEALFRIRSVNTNWVRKILGEEEIKESWANEYMETKNYQNVNS